MHVNLNSPSAVAASEVMQYVEITILAIRDIGIELEVVNTRRVVTKHNDLVVAKSEMSGHRATSFTEDTIFRAARSVAPSGPRITIGLSDFCAGNAVFKIIAHLCESIAANEGNHRNE